MMRALKMSLLFSVFLGCAPTPETSTKLQIVSGPMEPANGENTSLVLVEQECSKELLGEAGLLPPPNHRTRIRMNLDQLQTSLKQLMGGMEWGQSYQKIWPQRASMLGVPDYMISLSEESNTNMLFNKTLGDAARDLCPAFLDQEAQKAPEERLFLLDVEPTDTYDNNPDGVASNVQRMILLYHGQYLDQETPQFEPWLNFITNAMSVAEDPLDAWSALCVALISHPEFQSY